MSPDSTRPESTAPLDQPTDDPGDVDDLAGPDLTGPTAPTTGGAKRWLRLVGFGVAIVALSLCVYALVKDGGQVIDSLRRANPWGVVLGVVLSFGAVTWLGVLWHRCLAVLDVHVGVAEVLSWFFVGELGKYVPGGVWQVIGRSELAHQRRDVPRPTAYVSTLLAYATMCLGAISVVALASPWLALGDRGSAWAWALTPGIIVVPVATHPAVLGFGLRLVSRVTKKDAPMEPLPWLRMLGLVAWSLPAWVMLGSASAALAVALRVDANVSRVAIAAVAAWVIGFLAIPVPAGAGVREVVFATFSGMVVGPAVAVALASRVILILVDATGGAVGLVSHQVPRKRRSVV